MWYQSISESALNMVLEYAEYGENLKSIFIFY